jgi:small conductance mechanosensitive channel
MNTQIIVDSFISLFPSNFFVFVFKILIALWLFVCMYYLAKFVSRYAWQRIIENSMNEHDQYVSKLAQISWDIVFYILMIVNVLIFFQVLGFEMWFLVWWVSFGIGFALKEILWNMIAWFLILTNKKFKIWDIIQLQGWWTYFGRIEEITIRYSIIKTFDHRRVLIPNILLINHPVKTFSSEDLIRIEMERGVGFWSTSTILEACQLIKDFVNGHSYVIEKASTQVVIKEVSTSEFTLWIYFYYSPKEWPSGFKIKSDLRKELVAFVDEHNIDFPYQHVSLTTDAWDTSMVDMIWQGLVNNDKISIPDTSSTNPISQ